jgi:hypothetical protein
MSKIYDPRNLPKSSYVYCLLDPRTGPVKLKGVCFQHEPFYLGKGTGCRAGAHLREAKSLSHEGNKHKLHKIRQILDSDLEPVVLILVDGLTHEDALKKEAEIAEIIGYGFDGTGPLTNLIKCGTTNPILYGDRNLWFGREHSPETKKRISEACSKWFAGLSEAEKERINELRRLKQRGKVVSPETVRKRLLAKYGEDYDLLKARKEELAKITALKKTESRMQRRNEKLHKQLHIDFLRSNHLLNAGASNPMFGRGELLKGNKNGRSKKFIAIVNGHVFFLDGVLKRFCKEFKEYFNCSDPFRCEGFRVRYSVSFTEVNEFPRVHNAIVYSSSESLLPLKGECYEKCKSR